MAQRRLLWRSVIVLYFIIGLEILIMISPAAGFFYAAFNPVLLSLAQTPATRWLTAFYLPHMVSPSTLLLQAVRLAGSVLFVGGALMFLACAGQVYYHKFARMGMALRGLYTWIRHPQYLGLAITGLGLSILWPRFLTVALWAVMVALYYVLARDEERRMLGEFEAGYREYMDRTGMFLPRKMETAVGRMLPVRSGTPRAILVICLLAIAAIGGAFGLRAYTLDSLPLWSDGPVTALAILPNDLGVLDHRMPAVLEIPEIKTRLAGQNNAVLVYVMPKDYVMQGMIADTGDEWQLYKRHHAVAMIWDWIFHPFGHLEGGHFAMHHPVGSGMEGGAGGSGLVRRLIFLRVETANSHADPSDLFAINARRNPLFMADVEIHNLGLQQIRDLPKETGWGRVPTPIY
jgi:protein-S-isoprenylcysteine O-methyltransferase Ste14